MLSLTKAAVTLTALAAPLLAAPAFAAPAAVTDGPCTGTEGVTVVVDETHFTGEPVIRKCVAGDPDTAYDALTSAGVGPVHGTGQGQDGPYQYLCRIDGLPTAADDPCTGFATDAPYWAFWVPDTEDADWAYADEGVDTQDPAPGTVLGFSFGAGTTSDPNQMSLTLAQARDPNWTGP
jgi:hypothetical protein